MNELPSFLTTAQVEELETKGFLMVTDELLDAMLEWSGDCDDDQTAQWSGLGHA